MSKFQNEIIVILAIVASGLPRILGSIVSIAWVILFGLMPFAGNPEGLLFAASAFNLIFCLYGGVIMLRIIWGYF